LGRLLFFQWNSERPQVEDNTTISDLKFEISDLKFDDE